MGEDRTYLVLLVVFAGYATVSTFMFHGNDNFNFTKWMVILNIFYFKQWEYDKYAISLCVIVCLF